MNYCLWLIVLLNSLFGWFLAAFLFRFLIKNLLSQKQALIKQVLLQEIEKELGSENPLAKQLETIDLAVEIGPLLDARLEQITQQMAAQIPMGEFLLAGSLGQKMKLKIRNEIFNILPELKAHFIKKVSEELDLQHVLKEKIQSYDMSRMLNHVEQSIGKERYKFQGFGALIGALTGLFELILLVWLCG